MKKLIVTAITLAGVLVFQSCKNKAPDSTSKADSANLSKTMDTLALKPHISVDQNDAKFVVTAASDGMAEVVAGKMAVDKATNTHVKTFASRIVDDHSKVGNAIAKIARDRNITLPAAPDTAQQKAASDLSKKKGTDFDKAYVAEMVKNHKKAVKLFEDASKNLKDTTLRAFVIKTLPTLKMHLDSINAIHDSMK